MRNKLTEESSKKIANAHKKYSLWDGSKVHYHKNCKYPKTCFYLRYNSKDLQIGGFKEFISINIIHFSVNQLCAAVVITEHNF